MGRMTTDKPQLHNSMIEQRQIVEQAVKATHGDLCANPGCFRRITEGTVCPECDKQRHDDEIDAIIEEDEREQGFRDAQV